jgi:hypothetical protein
VLKDSAGTYLQAVDEVSRGIKEISADVTHLREVSLLNAENTRKLKDEVEKFRSS